MTEGVQSALSVSQRNGMSTVPAVCLTGGYDIGVVAKWWVLVPGGTLAVVRSADWRVTVLVEKGCLTPYPR